MNFRDEKVLIKFGNNLKIIRKERGFSQEDLAYSSNISLSQIARIETGKINTTLCTIMKIAETLGISASRLLEF